MLRILCVLLIIVAALPSGVAGGDDFPHLWERHDPVLQRQLDEILTKLGHSRAVKRRKLAVALVDISDLHRPRVAAVNGDHMIYAASIPKLAILLGAFVEVREGKLNLDAETRQRLTNMIRYSSNEDATLMLNRIGKRRLLDILQSEEFHLYDPEFNGGLWVGKEYGKSPAYRRDPVHNLSHGATAMQVARFYYLLETGRIVDKRLSVVMKSMLSDPGIKHKFVKGLQDYPDVELFRKSGSWRRWHGDSAIVESGAVKYIVVGLVEDARGGAWLSEMIEPIHELMTTRQSERVDH